ncbi:MAG: serine/threonine protein kinase [Candidatus Aenigmarchaeota archaeon]|nr:serine/threonine protein kinase [Candidatus Aenigmarchaeota archaeon]
MSELVPERQKDDSESVLPEIAQTARPSFREFIGHSELKRHDKPAENAADARADTPIETEEANDAQLNDTSFAVLVEKVKTGGTAEVDKYTLTKYLGEGGLFYVLKGHNKELDESRSVAVKILKSLKFQQALEQHKNTLLLLKHPNIPDIIDAQMTGEIPYVAEELIEGKTLADIISENRKNNSYTSEDSVICIGQQLLSALQYMHEKGVTHKDLKPQNIMVKKERVYVTDFNISDIIKPETGIKNTALFYTASTTRIEGFTDLYASPEQRQGKLPDKRSDLYSLGVLLFELLTNEICMGSDVDPKHFNQKISKDFTPFFAKALKSKPENRFQSAAGMQLALEELNKDNYGDGTIFYSTASTIHAVELKGGKCKTVEVYYSTQTIVDFCSSPDKRSIAVLEKDSDSYYINIKDLTRQGNAVLLFKKCLRDATTIFWDNEGIFIRADDYKFNGTKRVDLASDTLLVEDEHCIKHKNTSSPNNAHYLHEKDSRLLITSKDSRILETLEIAPFAKKYEWVDEKYTELFDSATVSSHTPVNSEPEQICWHRLATWWKKHF